MKNLLFTLALLVSFSSFGQSFGVSPESINDVYPMFNKCSKDFAFSDKELLEIFISKEDSVYTHKKNLFYKSETTSIFWRDWEDLAIFEIYETSDDEYYFDADEFIEFNSIDDEELKEIIDDIKGALSKISYSSNKLAWELVYNGCELESYNATDNTGRKKNHSEQTYNSTDNILNVLNVKNNVLVTVNFNNKTEKYYTNDILVSESLFSENGVFSTTYLDGVKDYTEAFDEETQIGKWQSFYPNGNLRTSGSYDLKGGAYGNWEFYSNSGNYTANADLDDKYKGKIKDSAEIYKSGVFLKKVRLKNKRKGKLLDLLNELDSDN
tara:strand:+ start:43 stop:1014 length:972 start_codon:yes stop_codon:yes gene_type:complete